MERGQRGASSVIAVVVLLGLTLTLVFVVLAGGIALSDEQRERTQVEKGTNAMVELKAESASQGTVQRDLQLTEGSLRTTSGGTMTVEVFSVAEGSRTWSRDLGAVEYRDGKTGVAYEGGGVWQTTGGRSVLVSGPDVQYERSTVVLEVPLVGGDAAIDRQFRMTTSRPERQELVTNPIGTGVVEVQVQSDHYRAWGEYFEQRFGSDVVRYVPGQDTVVVTLISTDVRRMRRGVIATSQGSELRLEGSGASIDAYDSSDGPYDQTNGQNAEILVDGNFSMVGGTKVTGDTEVSTNVDLAGNSNITRRLVHNDSDPDIHNNADVGKIQNNTSVSTDVPKVDSFVDNRVSNISDTNDNGTEDDVSGNALVDGDDRIDEGKYYFETFDLDGRTLVLDTTEGDISIAVRDWASIKGTLKVVGNGTVRFYVASEDTVNENPTGYPNQLGPPEWNLYVGKDAAITAPGDEARQMQVFGPDGMRVGLGGSNSGPAEVTGVIYTPSESGDGIFYGQHADLYGTVITGSIYLDNEAEIHYDKGLGARDRQRKISQVEFLHLITREVTVTDR